MACPIVLALLRFDTLDNAIFYNLFGDLPLMLILILILALSLAFDGLDALFIFIPYTVGYFTNTLHFLPDSFTNNNYKICNIYILFRLPCMPRIGLRATATLFALLYSDYASIYEYIEYNCFLSFLVALLRGMPNTFNDVT